MTRDEVIKGLEEFIADLRPFAGNHSDWDKVENALALLKAQEPRAMTLIEWLRAPEPADGECMCYEIKGEGLQAMLVKAFDGVRHLYGKAFRCWTSRPTDEQRKAVKWDD